MEAVGVEVGVDEGVGFVLGAVTAVAAAPALAMSNLAVAALTACTSGVLAPLPPSSGNASSLWSASCMDRTYHI